LAEDHQIDRLGKPDQFCQIGVIEHVPLAVEPTQRQCLTEALLDNVGSLSLAHGSANTRPSPVFNHLTAHSAAPPERRQSHVNCAIGSPARRDHAQFVPPRGAGG
jgi:hypothetical protein